MAVQNVILVALFFKYTNQTGLMLLFPLVYCGATYVLCAGLTPESILRKLQGSCVFIVATSRVCHLFVYFCYTQRETSHK